MDKLIALIKQRYVGQFMTIAVLVRYPLGKVHLPRQYQKP